LSCLGMVWWLARVGSIFRTQGRKEIGTKITNRIPEHKNNYSVVFVDNLPTIALLVPKGILSEDQLHSTIAPVVLEAQKPIVKLTLLIKMRAKMRN
jgi:hypothetical protein